MAKFNFCEASRRLTGGRPKLAVGTWPRRTCPGAAWEGRTTSRNNEPQRAPTTIFIFTSISNGVLGTHFLCRQIVLQAAHSRRFSTQILRSLL